MDSDFFLNVDRTEVQYPMTHCKFVNIELDAFDFYDIKFSM